MNRGRIRADHALHLSIRHQGVHQRLLEEAHIALAIGGRAVGLRRHGLSDHAFEQLAGIFALAATSARRGDAEGRVNLRAGKGLRHAVGRQMNRDRIRAVPRHARAGVVEKPTNPTGRGKLIAVTRGFPDFSGAEVAAIGVRIADVLDYRQFPFLHQVMEPGAARMKPGRVADAEDFVLGDRQRWAQAVVVFVFKRDEGVESVVAAGELHEHQNTAVLFRRGTGGERRLNQKLRRELTEREQADALGREVQELAARRRKKGRGRIVGHGADGVSWILPCH